MAAAGLSSGNNFTSLADLALSELGLIVPKTMQVSDWSVPGLTDEQHAYAAIDAVLAPRVVVPAMLAVPSAGALHEPALLVLRSCGIGVLRTNLRRYTADIRARPGVSVLFQRSADIPVLVEDGSADRGIRGRADCCFVRRSSHRGGPRPGS